MSGLASVLYDYYVRFLVWLGAAPPPGYEYLLADAGVSRTYTLKEGETLFAVARKFGVHYERIAQANAIDNPESVQAGQTVIIPPDDWDPASGPLVGPPVSMPEPEEATEPELPAPPPAPPEPIQLPSPTLPATEPEPLVPSPPVQPKPVAKPAVPPVEPVVEEPDWIGEALRRGEPESEAEEPTFLPDEEAPSEFPTEIPPTEGPEWLLALEPAPDTEVTAEAAPAADFSLSDRLEWLTATDRPASRAVETTTPAATDIPLDMIFRYEVQHGDTLSAIAKRYAVTVKEIIEANDIADPNRIFPGQKLTIPGYMSPKPQPEPEPRPEAPPPSPDEFFVHSVAEGDTLTGIAKHYNVTLRQLVEANKIQEPHLIRVGQRLLIPGVLEPPVIRPETPPPQPKPSPEFKPRPASQIDPNFPSLGPADAIRALYISYFAIGHPETRQHIFELLETTEFNAVVIDAKGDHGWISYPTQIPLAHEIGAARPTAKDFDQVLADLKARGIYTIARVVTFKDTPLAKSHPELAVKMSGSAEIWQDRENLSWSDPFLKPVWDYNVQVAVEAAQKGFNEIQFDYVRFPTASQLGAPQFSQEVTKDVRLAAITGFLSMVRGQLQPFGVKLAADTFGYTCWRQDDTLIGQDIERMGPYLDVLSPMLYPSTFGSGIPGHKFAIAYPYEVVYESAKRAVERVRQFGCQVRPWIQDFQDYRFDQRVYGKDEIQAQIRGCFDAGGTGFMVWDPRVKYTAGAYAPVNRR